MHQVIITNTMRENVKLKQITLTFLLLTLQVVHAFDFQQLRVTASTLTTNIISTYTIAYNRAQTNTFTATAFNTTPLNTTSPLTVTFPLQFTITSAVTCSYQLNTNLTYLTNNCTVNNNQIVFNNIIPSANFILRTATIIIANVQNPFPAGRTSPFQGTIGNDVALINGATGVNSFVVITPAASSCKFTFSPNLVSSTEDMVISLTLRNILPEGGTIGVQFPLTRQWSNQLDATRFMPISTSMVCSRISLNINSAIQCTGPSSGSLVVLSNVATSSLAAGTLIEFSINNFISPPTNQPLDGINITTFTSTNSIDFCRAFVQGLIPKTIPSNQFIISETDNNPIVVNQQYTIKFDFTTIQFMSQNDKISITFPSGTSINNFASANLGGTLGFDLTESTFYNSKLTLKLDGTNSLSAGQFFITISNFVAPPSILRTDNFLLEIQNNGFNRMISYQTLTAVTGQLSGGIVMASTTVNAVTRYTFTLTISNPITSDGRLKITFPSALVLSITTNCAILSGNSLVSGPICTYNALQNSVTFSSLNSSTNIIPAQTLVLTINGIRNAPSTARTDSFLVQTYYSLSDSTMVDSGSLTGVTATAGSIDNTKIVISSSSQITSQTGVTYSIQFVATHGIVSGGYVIINIPLAIVIDLATANNNCNINLNNTTPVSTPCLFTQTSTHYQVNFTNPFQINAVDEDTILRFTILNSATNPVSTQPVSPFSIFTYSSDSSLIASIAASSLTYSVTTPNALTTNTIERISNKNAELTSYTIRLSQVANLEQNAIILVQFPSSVRVLSTSTCSMTYIGVTTNVACGLISNVFKVISIGSIITAGTSFSLTFTNIRNPLSFGPLSGIQVSTKTLNDVYLYSRSMNTNALSNTIPTTFSAISYTYAPQQLESPLSLSITFQLSQVTIMPGHLLISIDPYFVVSTLSCGSFVDFTGSCTNEINNTIKVSGTFNNSVMGLTISGFRTPTAPPSVLTYSTIGSFDSNSHKIDESTTDISFSLNCNLPCRTCSTTNLSSCSSCYTNILVTSSRFFHAGSSNCYVNCPDTTYNNNSTTLCAPCDSNCLNCNNLPTFCTKCRPNSTFPFLNVTVSAQICVTSCSSGFYADTSIDPASCVLCRSPCQTCSSQVLCLTCLPGFFFLGNNSCLTECPIDSTIQNRITNRCDFCQGICRTCLGNVNNCTSCNTPLVFYNGSCQTSCPSGGTLAPFNGICTPCITQCLTCSLSINNCTSCNSSSTFIFFVNSSCITQCPIFFYNQTSTGSCLSCLLANINCVNCSSASTCYTCDTSFVLHNSRCLNYVPTGYVNISGVAVACSGDCETCQITATNCTKCRTLNLEANRCVSICQTGTIPISNVCSLCSSPCLTCSIVLFNCTSCVTNVTPPVFLSINSCQNTCPDFTYPNSSNFRCSSCINNCQLCTSATICLSCTNSTSFFNSTCMIICPSGMIGVNSICQLCTSNCKTCSGGTNICLTCNNGTFFKNSSCVTNCGTGLYIDYLTQTCIGCTAPCLTCSNTSTTCLSCTPGLFLINNVCETECSAAMYPLSGKCQDCASNCSACISATNCSSCRANNYLFNNYCIVSCPNTHAFINNGICQKCTTQNCYSCSVNDVCISCNSGFLMLQAICLDKCPSGYSSNGTHCNDLLAQVLQATTNSFPVPFSIAGVVIVIACLMSRLQFESTYLSGAVYALIGVLEISALLVFLGLYFQSYLSQPVPLYIGIGAALFLYLMNFVAIITQSLFLQSEKSFQDWNAGKCNTAFYYFTNFISLSITHKFKNILFCKLFTFKIFSAKLNKMENFRIFNIFSLVSLLHSGGALFAAGIALSKVDSKEQIYQQCIDVLVLTSFNIIMAFFNTHKDKDFFLQITPQGYSLHKKNNMIQQHLVAGTNFHDVGNDIQIEKGYINVYNHALSSQQALQFDKDSEMPSYDEYSDSSLAAIQEKNYEEMSVQAQDIIDQTMNVTAKTAKMDKTKHVSYQEISIQADELLNATYKHKGIDLSELPPQGFEQNSSNFTSYDYFKKVDKSVQGYPSRANYSMQMKPQQNDLSFQYEQPNKVDCSVQKYSNNSKVDISIQQSHKNPQDQSIDAIRSNRSYGIQEKPSFSSKNIFVQAEMQDAENQISEVSQQDEEVQFQAETYQQGIQPDIQYNSIAVQPTLDPSEREMGIQYEKQVNFNEFQEQIHQSNTESNVLFEQQVLQDKEQSERQLVQQKAEELQLQNDNVRSYQQQLEQRIRNKEKQLQEMKRKVQFKQRLNEKRRQDLANKRDISEQDVHLGAVHYVQQRPDVNPFKRQNNQSQSQRSKNTDREESLYNKPSEEYSHHRHQPNIKTQKSQKNNVLVNNRKLTQMSMKSQHEKVNQNIFVVNKSNVSQNSSSQHQENTLQEINVINDSKEEEVFDQRQKTIQEIKLQEVKPQRYNNMQAHERTKSEVPARKINKQHIEYNEIDDELISQDSLQHELVSEKHLNQQLVSGNHSNHPQVSGHLLSNQPVSGNYRFQAREVVNPSSQYQQEIQSSKKQEMPQKRRQTANINNNLGQPANNSSILTKKNANNPTKKSIMVDVASINRSLSGQDAEDFIQLEQASQSDRQPTGIVNNYYYEKPRFRQRSPSSMSGTIEEIPRHYSKVDHDKTINNHLQKTQKINNSPSKIEKQQLTNYYAGNLPKSNNQKSKNQIPEEKQVQKFRINKLYSKNEIKNNKVEQKIPSNIHNKNNNTFAIAAQNQLNENAIQRKPATNNYPLNTQKFQWEAQQSDKFISEDEQFSKRNNRNNLVKKNKKNEANFASHLVLPHETDKDMTSFHHLAKKQEIQAPNTATRRVQMKNSQVEQIQVHFQSEQVSNDLSYKMHNESPGFPRAFQTNRLTSNGQTQIYQQQSEDLDYKKQIQLGQMQKRPENDDLQDYYQKKKVERNSKQKRGKSNSKLDRSTEKIYMQRLDRYRK